MRKACSLLLIVLAWSLAASAQLFSNLVNFDAGFGYAYSSGNGGLNGFNIGAAVHFKHRVALTADYDGLYDTSNIGIFQITPVGLVTSKNHLQNVLIGPRFYFPGLVKGRGHTLGLLNPFAEIELGGSHLNSEIIEAATNTRTGTHDNGFTWMLGGGAEIKLTSHWSARGRVDLLRTHLANAGQSRVRINLGVAYFLKGRGD